MDQAIDFIGLEEDVGYSHVHGMQDEGASPIPVDVIVIYAHA